MFINYNGYYQGFLGDAFFDPITDEWDVDLVSNNSTRIVLSQPSSGIVTTLTGTGFTFSGDSPTGGTITGISFETSGSDAIAEITGISWGLVAFDDAMSAIEGGNAAPLAALFSASGGITIDAGDANMGLDMDEWDMLAPLITANMTITGTAFDDTIIGGAGNDTINPGANTGYDRIQGSDGNDIYDFIEADDSSYYELVYSEMGSAITVTLDATAPSGVVTSASGTDSFNNIGPALTSVNGGLGIFGSSHDDTFNLTSAVGSWFTFNGGAGNDTYNLTLNEVARLVFNWDGVDSATQGVVADLSTGVVSNDGQGGTDQINILGGDSWLEIRATDHNDSILGSSRGESFILEQGYDTLDGGDGTDRIRYDRSGVEAVSVDLASGYAEGTWDGNAFGHTLSNIEYVRGSLTGNDTLLGQNSADIIEGRGGDDSINGRDGDDRLYGEDGHDTLIGEGGNDTLVGGSSEADLRDMIYGGDGNDSIDGGYGNDELRGDAGADTVSGGFGTDTIIGGDGDDVLTGEAWSDMLYGNDGIDFINGGFGYDRVNGGTGADKFFHLGVADHGSDWIQDYSAAEGDLLLYGGTATIDQFQVNFTETANAGTAGIEEAFVIYRPTGQILWALVDGAAQDEITLRLDGVNHDLLA